jgi:protein-disulfide isomerase
MDQQNSNMNEQNTKSNLAWIIIPTVIISAWIIAMGILGAGWLISKELGSSNEVDPNVPINIDIPDTKLQLGNNDSKVTVIEFADFQCPFCGQWYSEVYSKLKSEFIDTGKIRFVFWDFAFLGEESNKAAEAALCAKDQNKFWEYYDKLFTSQKGENEGAFSDINLKQFAAELGLNKPKFDSCLDSRTYKSAVEESTAKAGEYGVSSTPSVFINGLKFEGVMPYESYKQIIESELAK